MNPKLAILHWLPAEMYPPLTNLVRHFAASGRWDVSLFTTRNHFGRTNFESAGVRIHRGGAVGGVNRWRRLWRYGSWQIDAFLRLLILRPDVVLYVEPQSSFPVLLLSFFRRRMPIFIHHHEYHEPAQFLRRGMTMARWFHRLEQWRLFKRAVWISHTNQERLNLFLADNPEIAHWKGRLLPNYPPLSWFEGANDAWSKHVGGPLRMVYVGSLSLRDTYIRELVEWVQRQPAGSVKLDVYAYNLDAETKHFLTQSAGDSVKFFPEGIGYDEMPRVLRRYHTGVLLYRAKTLNYQFNASNKLFEYLACGLDVVFPESMKGVQIHARDNVVPRVMEVNFENAKGLDLGILGSRDSLPAAAPQPAAEDALQKLEAEMLSSC